MTVLTADKINRSEHVELRRVRNAGQLYRGESFQYVSKRSHRITLKCTKNENANIMVRIIASFDQSARKSLYYF